MLTNLFICQTDVTVEMLLGWHIEFYLAQNTVAGNSGVNHRVLREHNSASPRQSAYRQIIDRLWIPCFKFRTASAGTFGFTVKATKPTSIINREKSYVSFSGVLHMQWMLWILFIHLSLVFFFCYDWQLHNDM